MGQDCCTNRFKTQIFSNSRQQIDTTSAFTQTTFNPFKNSLSISFLYLLTGKQVNLQNSLKIIIEIAEQCSKSHVCCFFDPNYLQKHHSLIEYQSQGSSFGRTNLSEIFWNDLEYFYEEGICNEIFQFKVILVIEAQGKGRHALSITRCMDPSRGNYFVVYDFLNRNKVYREKIFTDEESLNAYLNTIGEHFYVAYSPMPLSIKLLTFEYVDDKTESDIENIVNSSTQLTHNNTITNNININISTNNNINNNTNNNTNNNINNNYNTSNAQNNQQIQYSHQSLQQQLQSSSPFTTSNNKLNASISSSHNPIRSFQSLNQQRVSLPIKLQRNLSQNSPSEQICQLLQQQSEQLLKTSVHSTDQTLSNKQFIAQLKQINQNFLEVQNDELSLKQTINNQPHLPTPSVQLPENQNCLGSVLLFSGYQQKMDSNTNNFLAQCGCIPKKGNLISVNENDMSWEHENGQQEELIHYCDNHLDEAANFNQNGNLNLEEHYNFVNQEGDVEILQNNQLYETQNPFEQFNENNQQQNQQTSQNCPFPFQNGAIPYNSQVGDEDFLSDDASEIQICIQSATYLE